MAEPKLLLTDEEYAAIKVRAALAGMKPQDLMRDAVRAMMAGPAPTRPSSRIGQSATDVIQKLYSLEAETESLMRHIRDAASLLKGILEADGLDTADAGTPPGGKRMEESLLREMAEVDNSARAAIEYATPRDRNAKGADTGAAGAGGVTRPRKTR